MSPLWAVRARRQMTMSPSAIWASIIESPFTWRANCVLPLREPILEVEPFGLLNGLGQVAGGDLADQRHAPFFLVGIGELDGPRHVRLAGDQALFLQRLQMAHHAVGRADAKVIADLADRRPVTAVGDLIANKIEDFALAGGKVRKK